MKHRFLKIFSVEHREAAEPLAILVLRCAILLGALVTVQTSTLAQAVLELPAPGTFAERALKKEEKHLYQIRLEQNRFAQVRVEQLGANVYLSAFDPNGNLILTSESRNSAFGLEAVSVVAESAGVYRFEVGAIAAPDSGLGKYRIELTALREAASDDKDLLATERVFMAAMRLAEKGSFDGRREAIENYTLAAGGLETHNDLRRAAIARNQLAQTQNLLGEKRVALENFQKALALFHASNDAHGETVALRFIGEWHNLAGEREEAIEVFSRELEIAREIQNADDESIALQNLADVYSYLGENEKAVDLYEQALAVRLARQERLIFSNYILFNRMGDLYARQKNWQKALDFYLQAVAADKKNGGRTVPVYSLWRVGRMYVRLGDAKKALEFLNEGKARLERTRDPQVWGNTLLGLGEAHSALGEKQKAVEFFRQSAATYQSVFNSTAEAFAHFSAAQAERDLGDLDAARAEIEQALQIIESLRSRLRNRDFRLSYFATTEDYYDFYLELLWQQHVKSAGSGFDREAWAASERARARTLWETLREGRVDIRRGVSPDLLEQERRLQAALDEKAELHLQLTLARNKADEAETARVGKEIENLTIELSLLQTKIRQASPRYAALAQPTTPDLREAQNALDAETVILEYKLGTRRSFLWLVGRASLEQYELPPREEIENLARLFYEQISSRRPEVRAAAEKTSENLGRILLGAVSEKLKNKRLLIVADGMLQFIPFTALPSPQSEVQSPKYLVEEHEVVILPSASVLAELRRNSNQTNSPKKTLAVFADPIFQATDPRLKSEPPTAAGVSDKSRLKRSSRDFDFGENLPRLLATRAEARYITAFAPENQELLNMDFDASRENATSENLANYRILHFATHGLLDAAHPEFSGLVFSLYTQNGRPQDGFLRLNQIYNLTLASDLVVLSACQTALGKDVHGEGLIGLTRGFMYAGARRVVASLWKVDDAATAEFMQRFYQNLLQKKLSAASALRETQNEMKKIPRFRAPYFWAGFTLQGDWK